MPPDAPLRMPDYITIFSPTFSLEPRKTGLMIVDMQYATACRTAGLGKLLKEKGTEELTHYRFDRIENLVVPNILKLLDFFRKNALKVIYLTLGSHLPNYSDVSPTCKSIVKAVGNTAGSRNHEILDELKPIKGELVVNKTSMSAFTTSSIDIMFRFIGVEYLIFTGVSTNSCVQATAIDAADRGYKCMIAEDACGAASQNLHDSAVENFKRILGRVERVDPIIQELQKGL